MEVLSVTVDKAAEATGLSTQTIRRKVQDGELEAKKVGRRVLVDYESLKRLVSTQPAQMKSAAEIG